MKSYARYKDSEVSWIGEIPTEWSLKRIKHVAITYTGNSISDDEKSQYEDNIDAYPYISSKDITLGSGAINYDNGMFTPKNNKNFRIATRHCTLVCIEGGSAGKKIAYLTKDVSFVNKLCCFYGISIYPRFLSFYLQSDSFAEEFKLNISGMIGGVNKGELKNFSIVVPEFNEQISVAAYLDR